MAYVALYRLFRPDTLDGIVRQEHIVQILRNQIEEDRVGHAYLFCGPRGTGKTSIAKIFARAINCEKPVNGSPCGKCPTCVALAKGSSLDISEIDAASNNGVGEMRELREKVQYPPINGRYKVYIIDEVHMLTDSAFNALLKTLEEPPKHAVFILATTEPHKIPATILSRCMRFDFKLIPQEDLENHLKTILHKIGKEYEEEAVSAIARAGAGSVRDMLSIADICVSYSTGKLTYEDVSNVLGSADFAMMNNLCSAILMANAEGAIDCIEKLLAQGKGIGILAKDILQYLNECAVAKMCKNANKILCLPENNFKTIEEIAQKTDGHRLLRVTEIFAKVEGELRYSTSARAVLETAVLKASMPQQDYDIDSLISRVNHLEKLIQSGNYSTTKMENTPFVEQEEKKTEKEDLEKQEDFYSDDALMEEPVFEETYGYIPMEEPKKNTECVMINKQVTETKEDEPVFSKKKEEIEKKEPIAVEPNKSALQNRNNAFGLFLRSLRKVGKSGVLFTMCQDLESKFEGDKFILQSSNETVCRSLNREDHAKVIAQALELIGITDYAVRIKTEEKVKTQQGFEKLKADFADITIENK